MIGFSYLIKCYSMIPKINNAILITDQARFITRIKHRCRFETLNPKIRYLVVEPKHYLNFFKFNNYNKYNILNED